MPAPTRVALPCFLLFAAQLFACGGPGGGSDAGARDDAGDAASTTPPAPGDAGPRDAGPSCEDVTCEEARTVCVVDDTGPHCECEPGTDPVDGVCSEPERCEAGTCSDRGTCDDSAGAVVCTCEPTFAGPDCSLCDEIAGYHDDGAGGCTTDPCLPDRCTGDFVCVNEEGAAVCTCPAGTHDEDGRCVEDTSCSATSCSGHGTCDDAGGRVSCTCDEGFTGPSCAACDEIEGYHDDRMGGCTADPCLPNPCTTANRTQCVADGATVSCGCDPGYHLEAGGCVVDEVCGPDACSMRGACAVVDGRVRCDCDDGYTGAGCAACDTVAGYHEDGVGGCTTDPCAPNPCTAPNQGVCTDDGASGALCGCDEGHHPDGVGGCTDDPCVPDPCAASSMACRDLGGGAHDCYTPICDDDNPCTEDSFDGTDCVFVDLADDTPCSTTLCQADQLCLAGECQVGTTVDCDDGRPCTADSCDAIIGCVSVDDDTLVPDDGYGCTADACDAGVAVHTPVDADCDDGSWCSGVEVCAPGADSDPAGCVTESVPAAPGPDGPCGAYTCDDDGRTFTFAAISSPGDSCDDRVACTTNDQCTTDGRCVGTVTASCTGTGGTCAPSAFGGEVDVVSARVVGRVTYNGGDEWDDAQRSTDIGLYLRDTRTGVHSTLEEVGFSNAWDGDGYPVTSFGDRDDRVIDLPVLPGVYDVVYMRWDSIASDGTRIFNHEPTDPYPFARHVLMKDVVIGPGTNALDVDIAPARVRGDIVFGGASDVASFPDAQRSTDIAIYLRDRTTGTLSYLEELGFSNTWDGDGYPVTSFGDQDDRVIDLPVFPGQYDVVYMRWDSIASDGTRIFNHEPDDPYPFARHNLATNVTVGAGVTDLDVDVMPVRLSGEVLFEGASAFPDAQRSTDVSLYLRDRETGFYTYLEEVGFSNAWDGDGYPVTSFGERDDRVIDIPIHPGRYDVVYMRWDSIASDGTRIFNHEPDDPYPFARHVLVEDVAIGAGATDLDVDLRPGRVSGAVLFGAAAGAAAFPDAQRSTDIAIYLRDRTTGTLSYLEELGFSNTWDGDGYPVTSFGDQDDRVIDLPVFPGQYDVVYMRWDSIASDGTRIFNHEPDDPYPFARHVLAADITVGTGTTALDVDVQPSRVTGAVTFAAGAAFPDAARSTDIALYLYDETTGFYSYLEEVGFSNTWDGDGYPVTSFGERDDRLIDLPVFPGVYDVVYMRWDSIASDGTRIFNHEPDDPYPFARHVLLEDVVVGAAATPLNIDMNPTRISGAVVHAGASTFPDAARSTDISLYLRDRRTGFHSTLEEVGFSNAWDGDGYPITSFGDRDDRLIDLPVFPGQYDVVYMRWDSIASDGTRIFNHEPTDPYAFARHDVDECVSF